MQIFRLDKDESIEYFIENECWICDNPTFINNKGYNYIVKDSKMLGIHRYSYSLYNNTEIPKGKIIMHKCDNRACINPNHLQLGTYSDNNYDMYNKNRNNHKKLNNDQLFKIKDMLIKKIKISTIANKFNVSDRTIANIKNGKSTYTALLNGGLREWLMEVI